jgi:hypothetical protein
MYETTIISVPRNAKKMFELLLLLYPTQYRKEYGREIELVFYDLYQEEIAKKGNAGFRFWFSQVGDILQSVIEQHKELVLKVGMKRYLQQTLHVNKYNVIGFLFLLPFLLMFTTDLISRIAQGDLTHYNRPVYHYLSQTPLYWTPVLFSIVVLFPLIAVTVNVIPLLQQKKKRMFSLVYLRKNIITFIIILAGLGCIAIIKLHDFMPCMIHGLLKEAGLINFSKVFAVCRNA